MNTCARCGLSDGHVLDLDTGSACHPELMHCIGHLKQHLELARVQRDLAIDLLTSMQGTTPVHEWSTPDDPPVNDQ